MVFEGPAMIKFMILVTFFLEIQESFVFLREMKVFVPPRGTLGTPTCQNSNIPIGFYRFLSVREVGEVEAAKGRPGSARGGGPCPEPPP